MNDSPRTPPRFVPTLTTVLELPPEPAAPEPEAATPAALEGSATPAPEGAVAIDPRARLSDDEVFRLEEQLLHRVLQRVDLSLEEQLSDVVSAAVQQQLDAMIPRLRGEIETVLRNLVTDALARELSENPGSVPRFEP